MRGPVAAAVRKKCWLCTASPAMRVTARCWMSPWTTMTPSARKWPNSRSDGMRCPSGNRLRCPCDRARRVVRTCHQRMGASIKDKSDPHQPGVAWFKQRERPGSNHAPTQPGEQANQQRAESEHPEDPGLRHAGRGSDIDIGQNTTQAACVNIIKWVLGPAAGVNPLPTHELSGGIRRGRED